MEGIPTKGIKEKTQSAQSKGAKNSVKNAKLASLVLCTFNHKQIPNRFHKCKVVLRIHLLHLLFLL